MPETNVPKRDKAVVTSQQLALAYHQDDSFKSSLVSWHIFYENLLRRFEKRLQLNLKTSLRTLSLTDYEAMAIELFYKFNEEFSPDMSPKPIWADIGGGLVRNYPPLHDFIKKDGYIDLSNYSPISDLGDLRDSLYSYLQKRNILTADTLYGDFHRGSTPDDGCYMGNGAAELFNFSIRWISQDLDQVVVGKDVFLVPSPSYGYFSDPIVLNGCKVELIPALERNKYKITPKQLETCIIEINNKYFETHITSCCERYPTYLRELTKHGIDVKQLPPFIGNVKKLFTLEEFLANRNEIIAAIKRQCTDPTKLATIPEPPRPAQVKTLVFYNPYVPVGQYYTQTEIDALDKVRRKYGLYVIEDRAHEDLNYYPVSLGSFGNVAGQPPERLFILMTPSKTLCAADLRLGVMCAFTKEKPGLSPGKISIFRAMNSHIGTVGYFKRDLLDIAFSDSETREKFVKEIAAEYLWRQNLILQMIEGRSFRPADENGRTEIKGDTDATPKTKVTTAQTFNEYELYIKEYVDDPMVFEMLRNGIPGLKVLLKPAFGFYLLFDFSAFKGKYLGLRKLETALDFQMALLAEEQVSTIAGMLYHEKPVLRFSLGIERDEIITAFIRLHEFLALLLPRPLLEVKEEFTEPNATKPTVSSFREAIQAPSLDLEVEAQPLAHAQSNPVVEVKQLAPPLTPASISTSPVAVKEKCSLPKLVMTQPSPKAIPIRPKMQNPLMRVNPSLGKMLPSLKSPIGGLGSSIPSPTVKTKLPNIVVINRL